MADRNYRTRQQQKTQQKRPALKLGSWNVRTMLTGLSENLQDISDTRKTAVINNELKRLTVDIAAIQETRLADSGMLKEKDFTYYWQGKTSDERSGAWSRLCSEEQPAKHGRTRQQRLRATSDSPPQYH